MVELVDSSVEALEDAVETAQGELDSAYNDVVDALPDGVKRAATEGGRWVHEVDVATRRRAGDVVLDLPRHVQLDTYSCGAQCAASILAFHGKGHSPARIRSFLGNIRGGTDESQLARLFRGRGLRCRVLTSASKRDLSRAIDRSAPLLVAVDDNGHWAVVYGYGLGTVYVMDPSPLRQPGAISSWSDFKKRWNGWAMAVRAP